MSNDIQVLYEGTKYIKESKINNMIDEYKLLLMELSETVESMQMHFIHLINKLDSLGNTLTN